MNLRSGFVRQFEAYLSKEYLADEFLIYLLNETKVIIDKPLTLENYKWN